MQVSGDSPVLIDQYLRDAGVFYRKYDGAEGKERAWPLAHVPLIIDESEWLLITHGLTQRAELLEQIVADIYAENSLVSRGLLPPELVARVAAAGRPSTLIAEVKRKSFQKISRTAASPPRSAPTGQGGFTETGVRISG